jgi:hypothetical protein
MRSGSSALRPVKVPAAHVFTPYLPSIESDSPPRSSPIGTFSSQIDASKSRRRDPSKWTEEEASRRDPGPRERFESEQGTESRQASVEEEGPVLDDFLHPEAFAPPTGQGEGLVVSTVVDEGGPVGSEPGHSSFFVEETPDSSALAEAATDAMQASFPAPDVNPVQKRTPVSVTLATKHGPDPRTDRMGRCNRQADRDDVPSSSRAVKRPRMSFRDSLVNDIRECPCIGHADARELLASFVNNPELFRQGSCCAS